MPPILRGAEFYSVTVTEGAVNLLWRQSNPALGPVAVTISLPQSAVVYDYAYFDQDSLTIRRYRGPHGDPELDEFIEMHGAS